MIHTKHTSNFRDVIHQILKEYDGKAANIVIAGGSLLKLLDNADFTKMKTDKWNVYYADERITNTVQDLNHYQSQIFLQHVEAKATLLIEQNIHLYEKLFDEKTIDLALLGIGEDGHIASLFPGKKSLDSNDYICYIEDSPKPPPCRLTLTIRALNKVRNLYFFIPPKDGVVKDVTRPHESILSRITNDITVFLTEC
ncbi:6-phosphogluconolactonase - like protein [Trachipleistophora hominis]|uniref:6-phosphogluconolactonase-like protein n=1 Tax=Trachipleistophora hominis TaxID=72359 RepID=L7JUM8_TRAHO|nr:6-phosphogluconolactonase - like protein [Trachipleistophora hominis]